MHLRKKMHIRFKLKLFLIVIYFFICGHAPWGQHEVYRQMHMLVMCSKKDEGAFDFTKNIKVIFPVVKKLPELLIGIISTINKNNIATITLLEYEVSL